MTTTRLRPVPTGLEQIRRPTTRRVRDLAQLSPRARAIRTETARWALRSGHCCDFDALTVLVVCADERDGLVSFTEEDVWRMWWVDLAEWCGRRGVPVPQGLATAMRVLFDHLEATDGFGPGSDAVEDLLDAMEGAGAVWRDDRAPVGAG